MVSFMLLNMNENHHNLILIVFSIETTHFVVNMKTMIVELSKVLLH